jgi:hypothetical protein
VDDGLYIVSTEQFTAGFVIRDGRVVSCAPILQRRITYWITIARRIGD